MISVGVTFSITTHDKTNDIAGILHENKLNSQLSHLKPMVTLTHFKFEGFFASGHISLTLFVIVKLPIIM